MKFRKKSVVIEAVQWSGGNVKEIAEFAGVAVRFLGGQHLMIGTLEGDMCASPGDWIVKGVNNEFYPVKPDIMFKTYDPFVVDANGRCGCCDDRDVDVLELLDEKAYCCLKCFITKTRPERMAAYLKNVER